MRRFAFGRAGGNIGSVFSSLWKMASTRAVPIRRVLRFVRSMFRALCGDACVWRAEMRFCWGARWSCGSIGVFCVRSRRSCGSIEVFCVRSRRSAVLSKCFAFNHACCLPHSAKQDGLRNVAFLFRRGSGSPVTRSRMSCGYRAWLVYSGIVCFLAAIPTGDGERSRRRGFCALLRNHIGFEMLSAGRTLGQKVEAALRPRPRLRQRVFDSLDSLHLIRDVGALDTAKGARVQRRFARLQ